MAIPVHARSRAARRTNAQLVEAGGSVGADCPIPSRTDLLAEAMNNMPHGVVMFDSQARIVVSNRRYIEMYRLSDAIVTPGCTLRELIEHRKQTGLFSGDVEQYCVEILSAIARGQTNVQEILTADCRTIRVVNEPIPSGGWIVTHEDVTHQRAAETKIAHLAHLAHHDALTGLPNRALFETQLENALLLTAEGEHLAVHFVDLDNFKGINDTLGHPVGDELLRTVADRLRSCVRKTDKVARLGGDEFVILQTPVAHADEAADLAERVREAITMPCTLHGHRVVVDTSIGIALTPHDGITAGQILKSADVALYDAKASGRGTYRFLRRDMDRRMVERRALEQELCEALASGELEVHYQPLVNLERSTITACEALLRWRHPARGIVAPGEFLFVAEEIGLIARIDEWVIRTACAEAKGWPDDVAVTVNVSSAPFRGQALVPVIAQALAASGLAAHRLEVEITESALMEQTDEALAVLQQLHGLGVRIAIDGFGTGYSSLTYLRKFPFDKIKIDRSSINDLSDRYETTAIVRAATGFADGVHTTTTAGGVETPEQRRIVTALGCTEMQGNLFSAALPAKQLAGLLQTHRVAGNCAALNSPSVAAAAPASRRDPRFLRG